MKLDLSKQRSYWYHQKFNSENTTYMPALYAGLAIIGLIVIALA